MDFSSDNNYDYILNNDTETHPTESGDFLLAFQRLFAGYITLIFCISMPGNSFLLWVLRAERAWRSTSDILLLQLTLSNLCMAMTMPLTACNDLHRWIFGEWTCGLWGWLTSLAASTHVVIITAMAVHRYVTVVHALRLPTQFSSKIRVIVASVVMWLVCAAASIKVSVNFSVHDAGGHTVCAYSGISMNTFLFDVYVEIVLLFLIPFIIITFCYVHMWIAIRQGKVDGHHQLPKLILGITVGSFICSAPHTIELFRMSLIIWGVIEHKYEWSHAMASAFIIYAMTHFYSCLNPLFHIFGAQRFKRYLPLPCYKLLQRGDTSNVSSVPHITLHNDPV